MAHCVCIRCMGKGECFFPAIAAPVRCPLCQGLGVLGGVDGDCAAAVAAVFPAHYRPDEEEDAEVEVPAPPGLFLYETPTAHTRRAASRESKSVEQRCQELERKEDGLRTRVEQHELRLRKLEARGARDGGPG